MWATQPPKPLLAANLGTMRLWGGTEPHSTALGLQRGGGCNGTPPLNDSFLLRGGRRGQIIVQQQEEEEGEMKGPSSLGDGGVMGGVRGGEGRQTWGRK